MGTLTGGPAPRAEIPRSPEIKAYLYENAVIGETRRFRQIERYEAFYKCAGYDHQKLDWDGMSADQTETISPEIMVPYGFTQPSLDAKVRQKRPTAPSNIVKAIVERFTGLLFSESRHPEVKVEGDPDTEEILAAVREQCLFWAKWREARNVGGSCSAVLMTAHLRDGRFSIEVHNPKHCQVVWKDRRTLTPSAVLILYRYLVEEDDIDERTGEIKGTKQVTYLYRRIITEDDDTVYRPARLDGPDADLTWIPEAYAEHNLGFFPGVWVPNMPVSGEFDGDPDCQGAWPAIDTYDRMLAQMNKGTLANLDPTPVVRADPKEVLALNEIKKGSENAIYVGSNGDAKYMEMVGGGIEAGERLLKILKQNILDLTRCVLVDPQTLAGAAQSAKAIEYIYAPMLEKADDLRAQYGDCGVLPLLVILEKIARTALGTTITLPPDEKGIPRLGRGTLRLRPRADGKPQKLGPGGYITIEWGPYFSPTEDDKSKVITNAIAAKTGGLIDRETAVKTVGQLYGVRDVAGMIENIEREQSAEMEQALGPLSDLAGEEGGRVAVSTTKGAMRISATKAPPMGGDKPAGGEGGDRAPAAGEGGKP